MNARNGKIAKLPIQIRDDLNTRLFRGEPANRLVDWLNAQPEVIAVLQASFQGRPISEQNISEWKQGGFFEWLALNEPLEAKAAPEAAHRMTSEQLLAILAARHSEMIKIIDLAHEDFYARRLAALERLTHCAVAMRKCELQTARVQLERERLDILREKQCGQSSITADSITNSSPVSANAVDPSISSETLESPESDSEANSHAQGDLVHGVHSVHTVHQPQSEKPITPSAIPTSKQP